VSFLHFVVESSERKDQLFKINSQYFSNEAGLFFPQEKFFILISIFEY